MDNIRHVKTNGLRTGLVERRLQIIKDLVASSGLSVLIEWVSPQKKRADTFTRVPEIFMRFWHPVHGSHDNHSADVCAAAASATTCSFPLSRAMMIAKYQSVDEIITNAVHCKSAAEDMTDQQYLKVNNQLVVSDGVLMRSVKLPPNNVKQVPVLLPSLINDILCRAHELTGYSAWETT